MTVPLNRLFQSQMKIGTWRKSDLGDSSHYGNQSKFGEDFNANLMHSMWKCYYYNWKRFLFANISLENTEN